MGEITITATTTDFCNLQSHKADTAQYNYSLSSRKKRCKISNNVRQGLKTGGTSFCLNVDIGCDQWMMTQNIIS